MMRLQKYLAHAGVCSRRKAEGHILEGRVQVNQTIVTELGTKIDPEKDRVLFDGHKVHLDLNTSKIYIALHKPVGVITSCSQQNARIVIDLIDLTERIYPVGRLDKDSKGLLLLTNDGSLHQRLSHPSFDHEKEYEVTTTHFIPNAALHKMTGGMTIGGKKLRRATITRLTKNKFSIVLKEGRNRQIRKMVGKTGNKVDTLKRIRIANITLGNLKEGKWRYLTPGEIKGLTAGA